jgi:uroporphyrinogen decarboxylase
MGVNLFNMGFDISLNHLRQLAGSGITLLGNIPPRDVLAAGDAQAVRRATLEVLQSLESPARVILSCGGGMPPGVPSENIRAFADTVAEHSASLST